MSAAVTETNTQTDQKIHYKHHTAILPAYLFKILTRTLFSNWILTSCQPHRVTSGQSQEGNKTPPWKSARKPKAEALLTVLVLLWPSTWTAGGGQHPWGPSLGTFCGTLDTCLQNTNSPLCLMVDMERHLAAGFQLGWKSTTLKNYYGKGMGGLVGAKGQGRGGGAILVVDSQPPPLEKFRGYGTQKNKVLRRVVVWD